MIEINVCHIEATVVFTHTNKNKILLSHSLSQQITWLQMLVTLLWLFIAHWSQRSQLYLTRNLLRILPQEHPTKVFNESLSWQGHQIFSFIWYWQLSICCCFFFPQWEQRILMQIPINCNECFKSRNLKYSIVKLNPSNQICDIIPVTTVSVTKQYVGFSAFYS